MAAPCRSMAGKKRFLNFHSIIEQIKTIFCFFFVVIQLRQRYRKPKIVEHDSYKKKSQFWPSVFTFCTRKYGGWGKSNCANLFHRFPIMLTSSKIRCVEAPIDRPDQYVDTTSTQTFPCSGSEKIVDMLFSRPP